MDYLLGIDIGTSGTKGVLMDREGKIYARAGREYSVLTSKIINVKVIIVKTFAQTIL
jgi:sugar (pentulose or hexulose) kinase